MNWHARRLRDVARRRPSVEGDLGGRLHRPPAAREGAIHLVLLLLDRRSELEEFIRDRLARLAQHVLQRAGERLFELGASGEERVRQARLAAATCPSDAVNVVLDREREGVVDDRLDVRNVEAARGNVGGDEERDSAALKLLERARARVLRHVAMDGDALVSSARDVLLDTRRLFLIQREDEAAVGARRMVLLEELRQAAWLGTLLDHLDGLRHAHVSRKLGGSHVDTHGLRQKL
mmetsp:Transcript_32244/g.84535  ORF Transcript_32244/g.84535 Transcript_32244/m.84535 type:complete len:235 (-) Transcript_32244:1109-1813(-)